MADRFESAGRAFSDQAAFERRLGRELTVAADQMLKQVLVLARRNELHPATARVLWLTEVGQALNRLGIQPGTPEHAHLMDEIDMGLGDDAYDAAIEALRTSNGREDYDDALRATLTLDAPSLVAAGTPSSGPSWRERVKRVVRTAATGVQGVVTAGVLRARGIPTKQWITRRDDKVRDSHAKVDGKVVRLDQPFMVGGAALMHPGDPNGPIGETINCRCVMVGRN